eukprot:114753-Lingulodinium_polyedra.AAC.1
MVGLDSRQLNARQHPLDRVNVHHSHSVRKTPQTSRTSTAREAARSATALPKPWALRNPRRR